MILFIHRIPGYSLWAKDLIFVVSDGYLEGMQAWITAYHGVTQSSTWILRLNNVPRLPDLLLDLDSDPLTLSSGTVWTALNIDYSAQGFSHLGVFFGQS